MRISFRTRILRRCYEDHREASRRWGNVVGEKYIQRIQILKSVPTFATLFDMRMLRIHPLTGNMRGHYSVTIHARWRLIIERDESEDMLIIREVSNHYDD